jgi:uncharacterized protein HemX
MKHHSYVLIGSLILFLIIAAAGGGYLYYNYQASQKELQNLKKSNPQTAAKQEIQEIKVKVGELMELPRSEEPTLATVTDINKLKNQQFFSQAVNGDKVLIYTQSSKAILYRPETNKIIEVASVNLGQSQTVSPSMQTPKLKVVIYNGTMVKGAAETTQKTISQKITNLDVITTADAKKTDYTKTLVVDISGKQKTAASQLSQVLGASVGPLPKGEIAPKDTDLLIILGE